jgi:hypothetical protein
MTAGKPAWLARDPWARPRAAAGWLAATAVGAATGGVVGALTQAGVSEEDAHVYAEGVRRGGTLVSARVADVGRAHLDAVLLARPQRSLARVRLEIVRSRQQAIRRRRSPQGTSALRFWNAINEMGAGAIGGLHFVVSISRVPKLRQFLSGFIVRQILGRWGIQIRSARRRGCTGPARPDRNHRRMRGGGCFSRSTAELHTVDHGTGISEELLPFIYDLFLRKSGSV